MNAEDTREVLLRKAARLSEIATSLGMGSLAPKIVEDTHRRLEEARVRAVVVGEIKQGKSTLVNALIGKIALPTGVTPTTGAPVIIRSGAQPGTFLLQGLERRPLDEGQFERFCRGLEGEATGELELILDEGVLPPELELVDTPGVNDMSHLRATISQGELPRADILVLVLDATQLLNRAEMAFLRDALSAVGGLGDSGAHLLLAVNRIDLIAERERPKLLDHLEKELRTLSSSGPDAPLPFEIFLTDARTAAREPETPSPGVRGTVELKKRLFAIASTRNDMLPARARASLLRYGALLGHHAAVAAHASDSDLVHVRANLQAVQRELADQIDMTEVRQLMAEARERIRNDSQRRILDFRNKLQRTIEGLIDGASHRTLSNHLASAVHDAFLAFAAEEAQLLRKDLDQLSERVMRAQSEQVRRRLAHATMRLGFRGPTIYVEPPSAILEAGLVAIGIAGTGVMYFGNMVTGLLMAIAGPLATVFLREKSIRDARQRARAALPGALDRAAEALREQVRRVIDGHLAALDEHVLLANLGLREQLEGLLTRVESELAANDQSARDRLKDEVRRYEIEIEQIRIELNRMAPVM